MSLLPQHPGLLPLWLLFVRSPRLPPPHPIPRLPSCRSPSGPRLTPPKSFHMFPSSPTQQPSAAHSSPNCSTAFTTSTTPSFPVRQSTRPLSTPAASPDGTPGLDALAARLCGTWTLLAAVTRLFAAYDFDNGPICTLPLPMFRCSFNLLGMCR